MAKKQRAELFQTDDGQWSAACLEPPGSCAPFVTSGWSTKSQAAKRIAEHLAEHDTGTLMTPMDEFCATHAPELLP